MTKSWRLATPLPREKTKYVKEAMACYGNYVPKTQELIGITVKQVVEAIDKLNSKPRKCLNSKIPYEVFEQRTGVDVSCSRPDVKNVQNLIFVPSDHIRQ